MRIEIKMMFLDVTSRLVYQVLNASIREYPFPHFFNTDVFPKNFYDEIMKHMPDENDYETLSEQGLVHVPSEDVEKFERRSVITLNDDKIQLIDESIRDFWLELTKILTSPEFLIPSILKFKPWAINEYGEDLEISYSVDVSLFRDTEKWDLGPHTDQQNEIMAIFLYLPPDDTTSYLGTSIYTPKEPGFTCKGGMRYDRKDFDCANTLPFLPNSVAGFYRNNTSFHGIDCVKKTGDVRNLISIQVIKS
jgi:hypothetical protein